MKTISAFALGLTLVVGGFSLAACGSSNTTAVETSTTGQQLVDLKKALDEGVITKSEYEHKRKEILKK